LINGVGEWVCFIVNDLLNWELIKNDFRFWAPIVKEEELKSLKKDEEDEENNES